MEGHHSSIGSLSPSINRRRSLVVFARLEGPLAVLLRFLPRAEEGGMTSPDTGVAAPEGFALTSSKCPSPIIKSENRYVGLARGLRLTLMIHIIQCNILLLLQLGFLSLLGKRIISAF